MQRSRNGVSPIIAHGRLGTAVMTLSDNFSSQASQGESPLRASSGCAQRPRAGGDVGCGPCPGGVLAGLTAPGVSHRATGSPRKQGAGLTTTGSLGAVGGAAWQCTVAATHCNNHRVLQRRHLLCA